MKYSKDFVLFGFVVVLSLSCNSNPNNNTKILVKPSVASKDSILPQSFVINTNDTTAIKKSQGSASEIVAFAKTLEGVPYLYASSDPYKGFDCSGFITYVFNHFGIEVPRSSIDFTHVGIEVKIPEAVEGDLILFTGTDTLENFVGHMGIITDNTDSLRFIHSTSGKKNGVTITALNPHYLQRFVKVIRIF